MKEPIKLMSFQDKFAFSIKRFPAFVAGWGTGKSMCGIIRGLYLSEKIPRNLGLVVRKDYTDLRDSTIKDFERYTGLKVSEQTKEVKLSNGSQILFRHASELDTLKNINAGWFWIEQAEELESSEQWFYLHGRLRRQGPFRSGWITANTNGHNWIWELWKGKSKYMRNQDDYELHTATTLDNKKNVPQDFIDSLEGLPEQVYARFVLNDWNIAEGLIWPEFDEAKHCFLSYPVEDSWKTIISLDHGHRAPTAVLFGAVDYDGALIIYAEHYQAEQLPTYHATQIKSLEPYWDRMQRVIDPSCRNKIIPRNGQMYSIIDEYIESGISFTPAQNDVQAGIVRVGEYFKHNRIRIFADKCPNLVRELKAYKYKHIRPGTQDKEGVNKVNDHTCDALKYMVLSRPQPSVKPAYHNIDPAMPVAADLLDRTPANSWEAWHA